MFRSTHAEIRPVASKDSRWNRGTPYSRPGQWGDRGAHGGYGGYGSGGYAATRYGSGYERGGRGRGMRGGRGGGIPSGSYDGYSDGGGSGGYSQYSQGGYDYNAQQGGYGQYNAGYAAPSGGPGGNDPSQMVAYPPIRSQTQGGGRTGGEDLANSPKHAIKMRGLPYSAKEKEVLDFFLPHVPARVDMDCDQYGRPSGTAEARFNTHEEAEKAMEKHNGHMGEWDSYKCMSIALYSVSWYLCMYTYIHVHVCMSM